MCLVFGIEDIIFVVGVGLLYIKDGVWNFFFGIDVCDNVMEVGEFVVFGYVLNNVGVKVVEGSFG